MKSASYDELIEILKREDLEDSPAGLALGTPDVEVVTAVSEYFSGREFTASVLGIDIYRYSKCAGCADQCQSARWSPSGNQPHSYTWKSQRKWDFGVMGRTMANSPSRA